MHVWNVPQDVFPATLGDDLSRGTHESMSSSATERAAASCRLAGQEGNDASEAPWCRANKQQAGDTEKMSSVAFED